MSSRNVSREGRQSVLFVGLTKASKDSLGSVTRKEGETKEVRVRQNVFAFVLYDGRLVLQAITISSVYF